MLLRSATGFHSLYWESVRPPLPFPSPPLPLVSALNSVKYAHMTTNLVQDNNIINLLVLLVNGQLNKPIKFKHFQTTPLSILMPTEIQLLPSPRLFGYVPILMEFDTLMHPLVNGILYWMLH